MHLTLHVQYYLIMIRLVSGAKWGGGQGIWAWPASLGFTDGYERFVHARFDQLQCVQ